MPYSNEKNRIASFLKKIPKNIIMVSIFILVLFEAYFYIRGINTYAEMCYYAPILSFYSFSVMIAFKNSIPLHKKEIKEAIIVISYSFCAIFGLCVSLYTTGKIDQSGYPHGTVAKYILGFAEEDFNLFQNIGISAGIFFTVFSSQLICLIFFAILGIKENLDNYVRIYFWFGLYWEREKVTGETHSSLASEQFEEIYESSLKRSHFGIDALRFFSTLVFKCFCAAIASLSAFLLFLETFFPLHLPGEHSSRAIGFILIVIISLLMLIFFFLEKFVFYVVSHFMKIKLISGPEVK